MTTCSKRLYICNLNFHNIWARILRIAKHLFCLEDIPQIQSKKAFNHATKRFREDKMEMNGALRKKKVNFHGVSE